MIHVLEFPAWDHNDSANENAPDHAVAFAQLKMARVLPPEAGGLKMGSTDDDLQAAVKIGEAFEELSDSTVEGRLRASGGYMALSAHGKKRLLLYWSREEPNVGAAGLRALLGDSRYKVIQQVEKYLKSDLVREMDPDEYAKWKADRDGTAVPEEKQEE